MTPAQNTTAVKKLHAMGKELDRRTKIFNRLMKLAPKDGFGALKFTGRVLEFLRQRDGIGRN